MVIIITGGSHTGKTHLAQLLMEKYKYPYTSLDHLKMGLIRSHNTSLTVHDDNQMTDYLWPIAKEMIKTAIENEQNLILEGCYIPFDYQSSFTEEYLDHIRYICLAFLDDYIDKHFEDEIVKNANIIEKRLDDEWLSIDALKKENEYYIEGCKKYNLNLYVIKDDYKKVIKEILKNDFRNKFDK